MWRRLSLLAVIVLALAAVGCSHKKPVEVTFNIVPAIVKVVVTDTDHASYKFLVPVEQSSDGNHASPYVAMDATQGPAYFALRGSIDEWNMVILVDKPKSRVSYQVIFVTVNRVIKKQRSAVTDSNGEVWVHIAATEDGPRSTLDVR